MTMTAGSQLAEASSRVEVRFGTTQPQRRWTVLIRIILAIPQFFVLFFVGIGALVVVFLGWFAALFTGRLPASFAKFLLGYVRWTTRVYAYEFLMTDAYPPFALDPDPSYPVDVTVTTGRLNRFAVFFRIILVIPAAIVSGVITLRDAGLRLHHLDHHPGDRADAGRHLRCVGGRHPLAGPDVARTSGCSPRTTRATSSATRTTSGKRMEVTASGTVVSAAASRPRLRHRRRTRRTPPSGGRAHRRRRGDPDQPTIAAPVAPPPPPLGTPTDGPAGRAPAAGRPRRPRRLVPRPRHLRLPERRCPTGTTPSPHGAPPPPGVGPERRPATAPSLGSAAAAVGSGPDAAPAATTGVRTDATPAARRAVSRRRATHRSHCGPWP